MWPWRVKMPTQNLLRLLLLLMLMLRIMLATACWFGSWRLGIKLIFCSDFEHKGWSGFWRWNLFSIFPLMFCRGYEVESWTRFWSWDWSRTWTWSLSVFQMMMFGWDFVLDAWSRFWKRNLIKICVRTTQPSGPLCLWQCLNFYKGKMPKIGPKSTKLKFG